MKTNKIKNRVLTLMMIMILVFGTMTIVLADGATPTVNFTSSGVTFNKEANLLRFNLKWSHPNGQGIKVMYFIDNGEEKTLGEYENQDDQVIAHIYLNGKDVKGSVLNLYAVDKSGNKSENVSSEFQIASSSGITIEDGVVPLSVGEGTWAIVNLFLAALSVAMVAVSLMLYIENRMLLGFKHSGRVRSVAIAIITLVMAIGNAGIFLTTQNLKHQMVMVDDVTIAMLIVTVFSIVTTMILAVRAFKVQSEKDMDENN